MVRVSTLMCLACLDIGPHPQLEGKDRLGDLIRGTVTIVGLGVGSWSPGS